MTYDLKSDELWQRQLAHLKKELIPLVDKPEETPQSSLKALWLTAGGIHSSVEAAASHPLCELDEAQQAELMEMVERRLAGEPLSYITRRQSFMGLEMLVAPGAMIPRKETEILAQTAIELASGMDQDKHRIMDICTGSGNLPVVFAKHLPDAEVFAADLSYDAIALARENVARHGLQQRVDIRQGDLLAPFEAEEFYGNIDILTCNPPYISSGKLKDIPAEIIEYEPDMAFAAGSFGIDILNRLVKDAPRFLRKDGGRLCFEIGVGQGALFIKRMQKNDAFSQIDGIEDENGEIRVIVATI